MTSKSSRILFIENICSTCQIFNRAIFDGKHQPSSPVTPVADIANIIGTLQCEDLHANVMFDGALKGTLFLSAWPRLAIQSLDLPILATGLLRKTSGLMFLILCYQ